MNVRFSTDRFLPLILVAGVLTACGNSSNLPDNGTSDVQGNVSPSLIPNTADDVVINEPPTPTPTPTPTQPVDQPVTVTESIPEAASLPESQQTETEVVGSESGLSAAQLAQLPEDCLLTQDSAGVAYCFSPATRKYTAVLEDGRVLYDFNLPGDNATNSVKGLFIGPENTEHDVCLVADVTVAVDDSEFEISCFQASGEFIGTVPTLATPPRYGDPVKNDEPQGVNINNEPLLVAQADFGRVFIAGTRYRIDTRRMATSGKFCLSCQSYNRRSFGNAQLSQPNGVITKSNECIAYRDL